MKREIDFMDETVVEKAKEKLTTAFKDPVTERYLLEATLGFDEDPDRRRDRAIMAARESLGGSNLLQNPNYVDYDLKMTEHLKALVDEWLAKTYPVTVETTE